MSILKSKSTTYEFSLEEMKKLIANDLGISIDAVTVKYVMEDTTPDRYPTTPSSYNYQVTKVQVTIDETKLKK